MYRELKRKEGQILQSINCFNARPDPPSSPPERKGLSYTSLLRMWIKEHLNKEERLRQDA